MPESDLASFHYKTVFISDTHLGSGKTSSAYLYEFLKNIDYTQLKDIYLAGDVIGGWEHENGKQDALPEIEKRILDILNYAADHGIKIHYIPGNHDEKLRPMLADIQARKNFDTFHENFMFEREGLYETEEPASKKFKVIHGDEHDPELFVKPWFRPVAHIASAAYDTLVKVNYSVSKILYDAFGIHLTAAKTMKDTFKAAIGAIYSRKSLMKGLDNTPYDGIMMGHTHMASSQKFLRNGRTSYLINDGDWVESGTACYVDATGGLPKILDYKKERERRGFGALPTENDHHPSRFSAYRDRTNRQARFIHATWQPRGRKKQVATYDAAMNDITLRQQEGEQLRAIFDTVSKTGQLNDNVRQVMKKVSSRNRHRAADAQKKGLTQVFNKYAGEQQMAADDILFTKTVLRDLMTICDRQVEESAKAANKAAKTLDYEPYMPRFAELA